MNKRTVESLLKVHLTHLHVGCQKYMKEESVTYNFTIHFKHKYQLVVLQSVWYKDIIPCILDAISILEALNEEVKANWAILHEEMVVTKYLINEINAKYNTKVGEREDIRRRSFLPPLIDNRRDNLDRKIQKCALKKAQVSKLNRETYEPHFRIWEKFDFELPG